MFMKEGYFRTKFARLSERMFPAVISIASSLFWLEAALFDLLKARSTSSWDVGTVGSLSNITATDVPPRR